MHSVNESYSHDVEGKQTDRNEKKNHLKKSKEMITIRSRKMVISVGEGYGQEGTHIGGWFLRGWQGSIL